MSSGSIRCGCFNISLRLRTSLAGLAKANVIESAGRVLDTHRMLLTIVTSDLMTPINPATAPLANIDGQPVYVRDVATVELQES